LFQRTRIPHVQNDLVSDASRLLDLGGLSVDRVASDAFGGRVVHVVTADETASACPSCGVLSVTLKGRVCTRPRDIPYGTRVLRLIWHKRRWRCKERLCPRASFTESLPSVRARSRLTTRLRPETFAKMWNSLIDTGDAGVMILQAYTVKEELRSLLGLAGTNPERHVIRARLDSFYQSAAATDAPEAHRLAATVEAWWPAIEAGLLTGYSNSRSEGYNRLAKHQGRNAFGFRNPVNQRRRIRWSCTRQYRRASAARSTLPA
jgi:transposase